MPLVPLSVEDCHALGMAASNEALRQAQHALVFEGKANDTKPLATKAAHEHRANEARLRDLADLLGRHAVTALLPVVPEGAPVPRRGPPPGPVDTFPLDHPSRRPQ